MSKVMNGKVKFYNKQKGYGFIIPDIGGKDIFFHIKDSNDAHYNTDDRVAFDTMDGKKGVSAVDVRIVK